MAKFLYVVCQHNLIIQTVLISWSIDSKGSLEECPGLSIMLFLEMSCNKRSNILLWKWLRVQTITVSHATPLPQISPLSYLWRNSQGSWWLSVTGTHMGRVLIPSFSHCVKRRGWIEVRNVISVLTKETLSLVILGETG